MSVDLKLQYRCLEQLCKLFEGEFETNWSIKYIDEGMNPWIFEGLGWSADDSEGREDLEVVLPEELSDMIGKGSVDVGDVHSFLHFRID